MLPEHVLVDKRLIIKFEEVEKLREIAAGASGKVFLGKWKQTKVAVKQFWGLAESDTETFVKECAMHHGLRHPNIVQLLAVVTKPLCVLTEWMARGALFALLQDSATDLSWDLRLQFAAEIARGMVYVHSCGLLHRDLKSLNVLIDEHWHAKIGDFGQATPDASLHTAMKGTLFWTAPEVFDETGRYSGAADVYSFGVVFYELVTRDVPFAANPDAPKGWGILDYIRAGGRPIFRETMTPPPRWVELLMSSCWAADEDARPSFPKVLDTLVDNSGSATRVVRSGSDGEDAPLFNKFAPPVEETEDVEMTPGAGERTPPPEQTDKAEDESRSPC